MRYILILLALVGCKSEGLPPPVEYCKEPDTENDERPDILIIGDSISLGYTPAVRMNLPDYDVIHNDCNARSTRNGVLYLDDWLDKRERWEIITFNFGIWDSVQAYGITPEEYRENLTELAARLKERGERLIFFTTTDIPDKVTYIEDGREDMLNAIALEIMEEFEIEVYDLNGLSRSMSQDRYAGGERQNDVHFTATGYLELGQFVTDAILTELQ